MIRLCLAYIRFFFLSQVPAVQMGPSALFGTPGAMQRHTVNRAEEIQILIGLSQEEVQEEVLLRLHLSAPFCESKMSM